MSVKLLIIGGVAGGATAAARARRLDEDAEIILFERGEHISFANCGLPYFIGHVIKRRDALFVTTPEEFSIRYNVDVRTFNEVLNIDPDNKLIEVKDLKTGHIYTETYDKIILSPGAEPLRPPIEGVNMENIFNLRNIPDSDRIKDFVDSAKPKSAVIVGGGFIGLEMAENLVHRGLKTTVIEMLDQVMAPLDYEMAAIVHTHLKQKGVICELNNGVKAFARQNGHIVVSTQRGVDFNCDVVILSIGIKPESILAKKADLEIGTRGGIKVDAFMKTSDPDIYAVGDAVEVNDFVTALPTMTALAGPANKQGRIAADNVFGRKTKFIGTLGTAVVKIFDMTVASTGANEKLLIREQIPYLSSFTQSGSHASYYPGAQPIDIKLLFSPDSGKVLGAQMIGRQGVDKRIDVIATAIRGSMTVFDLEELELAYAPPYSSAKDPVNIAGFVAANIIKKDMSIIHWTELEKADDKNIVVIDLRTAKEIKEEGTIEEAVNIPVDDLRDKLDELDKSKSYYLFCAVGFRGYLAHRILEQNGFTSKNISGGYDIYKHRLK
ncbi:MAG: FAD-dependent oxidoreductase [Deltaproteobacteria bacterium]|nr:FAD-dependent oxidoreductase [Deltaproteobacteria bacterium]MBW2364005.1 FAD-dependent oxidoreductase [Deltaproteobacteria bacterium]